MRARRSAAPEADICLPALLWLSAHRAGLSLHRPRLRAQLALGPLLESTRYLDAGVLREPILLPEQTGSGTWPRITAMSDDHLTINQSSFLPQRMASLHTGHAWVFRAPARSPILRKATTVPVTPLPCKS
jgi:hypothetical protein